MVIQHNKVSPAINVSSKSIFNSYLDLYEPVIPQMEPSDLIKFQIDEDILDDSFIAGIDLTEEQLAYDITMCRYFEKAE